MSVPSARSVPLSGLAAGERVLVASTADLGGGAERIAWDLVHAMRAEGLPVEMVVGRRRSDHPAVHDMPHGAGVDPVRRRLWDLYRDLRVGTPTAGRLRLAWAARLLAAPRSPLERLRGHEDFEYPGSWRILDLPGGPVRLLHAHNLHGYWFDLRALPSLSRRVPTILTLHDTWLTSGHCAFSMGCERWRTGCGACPDLSIYPAVRRDRTAENWQRKAAILREARVHLAAPCQWVLDQARASILAPAIASARVIHNGVDRSIFRPGDKAAARHRLGLPRDARILLFVANGGTKNRQKDFATIEAALQRLEPPAGEELVCVGLGGAGEPTVRGRVRIVPMPFQRDREAVADHYRAADLYVHAARAETFPTVILEALASGLPVVATAVGGIAEQVRSLEAGAAWAGHARGAATGVLVQPRDPEALAAALSRLLGSGELLAELGANAARDAAERFCMRGHVAAYLRLYTELLGAGVS